MKYKHKKHRANAENLRKIQQVIESDNPDLLKLLNFHETAIIHEDELFPESDPLASQKNWYIPICNKEEVNRIFNPQNASDYLLKLRADALFESYRLQRVIMARKNKLGEKWVFSEHFSMKEVNHYIENLSEDDRKKIESVPIGYIFTFETNGLCIKTEYGNIITVSESMKYFLYFMNLFFFDFDIDVPDDVRFSSLLIALRTMLETESTDFELDPRGEVPDDIHLECQRQTEKQIEFIFGHEIAHHLLNHLENGDTVAFSLYTNKEHTGESHTVYNFRQLQEFEADIEAINRPIFKYEQDLDYLVQSAILFFAYIDIFEAVENYLNPPMNSFKTHPDPIERLWRLYNSTCEKITLFSREDVERIVEKCRSIKETIITAHLPYNVETYEFYGSVYLGQWRGKELIDRVDY